MIKANIKVIPIKGRDLQPGDLFSSYGPDYWKEALNKRSIGERVYIRTNAPSDNVPDADKIVWKVVITSVDI